MYLADEHHAACDAPPENCSIDSVTRTYVGTLNSLIVRRCRGQASILGEGGKTYAYATP